MKATELLRNFGQSLWLDNITRDLLNDGTLKSYIDELSISGLTSNPTIFDHAIKNSSAYDEAILDGRRNGKNGEALFLDLALEDIRRAAELFRPVHDRTNGVDGWVSLEVPPSLAYATAETLVAAKDLSARADRLNVFIKIPGTPAGLLAIEEAIFAGVPINVTLLFSAEQYIAAAEAYMRGIERRIEVGLNPKVASVASLFISRWDVAVANKVPEGLKGRLGIAVAGKAYQSYLTFLASPRWQRAYNFGARAQRLLWASTGTKDPLQSVTLYVESLAAPFTVNTMPDATLKAFGDHGALNEGIVFDQTSTEEVMRQFAKAGIDVDALGLELQNQGAKLFVKSWVELMNVISAKGNQLLQPK
jgi:transaldolase